MEATYLEALRTSKRGFSWYIRELVTPIPLKDEGEIPKVNIYCHARYSESKYLLPCKIF